MERRRAGIPRTPSATDASPHQAAVRSARRNVRRPGAVRSASGPSRHCEASPTAPAPGRGSPPTEPIRSPGFSRQSCWSPASPPTSPCLAASTCPRLPTSHGRRRSVSGTVAHRHGAGTTGVEGALSAPIPARRQPIRSSMELVAKPGFEPGRPFGQRCLRPPRLPFRHFARRNRSGGRNHGRVQGVLSPMPNPSAATGPDSRSARC